MTIINLDRTFTPFGQGINYENSVFPSGFEVNIRLPKIKGKVMLTTRIRNSNDIFLVLLATNALHNMGVTDIKLFMPYLPYARQDRAMIEEGEMPAGKPYQEALSLKVFADLINTQKYTGVYFLDPHSDVSAAVFTAFHKISNHDFVRQVLKDKTNFLIACPDAGAEKKVIKLCQAIGYTDEIVMCEKVRDVVTGNLKSIKVHADDLQGKDIYTVDDICDGGGTYIMQGEELKKKNCGNRYLVVTHGLFTKGLDVLKPAVEHIYTTDSFKDIDSRFVTQYKIEHLYNKLLADFVAI